MPDYTQDHSIPYPLPTDPIRGSTSDYILTDLRDLARGTDSAITTAMGTRAPLSHTHSQADVSGLSAALASAGETAQWGSVSGKPSAYPPSSHSHAVSDVTGLADRLAALEYWSGVRDVSALLQNGWAGIVTLSRVGNSVSLALDGLSSAQTTASIMLALPSGFRAIDRPGARSYRTMVTAGGNPAVVHSADIDRWGNVRIFTTSGKDKTFSGSLEFATADPIPTTLPGTPV